MSDTRLVSSLVKAGVSADEIESMDRASMINRWANIVAAGADKGQPMGAAVAVPTTETAYDVELEREKLAFGNIKWKCKHSWRKSKYK